MQPQPSAGPSAEKLAIQKEIEKLRDDIDNNFGLSRQVIMAKKRELNQLTSKMNNL